MGSGAIKLVPANTQFAYMDTKEQTDVVIEFISGQALGHRNGFMGCLYDVFIVGISQIRQNPFRFLWANAGHRINGGQQQRFVSHWRPDNA